MYIYDNDASQLLVPIAGCNHTHDCTIGISECHMLGYCYWISLRLYHSNTVNYTIDLFIPECNVQLGLLYIKVVNWSICLFHGLSLMLDGMALPSRHQTVACAASSAKSVCMVANFYGDDSRLLSLACAWYFNAMFFIVLTQHWLLHYIFSIPLWPLTSFCIFSFLTGCHKVASG